MMFKRTCLFFLVIFGTTFLSSCSEQDHLATVVEQSQYTTGTPDKYQVARGDTLYSIAFAFGADYRDLAKWNHLPVPYAIKPGQWLVVQPTVLHNATLPKPTARVVLDRPSTHLTTKKRAKIHHQALKNKKTVKTKGKKGHLKKKIDKTHYVKKKNTKKKQITLKSHHHSQKKPKVFRQAADKKVEHWRWPVKGKVVKGFTASQLGNKGIDIAGTLTTNVHATASGVVVYSGSGLRGYGNLIIIKHNARFLSAYAYNSKRLVKEGEQVKAGQTIAKMGKNNAGNTRLHFEIRRDGKPVNPVRFLR